MNICIICYMASPLQKLKPSKTCHVMLFGWTANTFLYWPFEHHPIILFMLLKCKQLILFSWISAHSLLDSLETHKKCWIFCLIKNHIQKKAHTFDAAFFGWAVFQSKNHLSIGIENKSALDYWIFSFFVRVQTFAKCAAPLHYTTPPKLDSIFRVSTKMSIQINTSLLFLSCNWMVLLNFIANSSSKR